MADDGQYLGYAVESCSVGAMKALSKRRVIDDRYPHTPVTTTAARLI
jgi:hypothetical protein